MSNRGESVHDQINRIVDVIVNRFQPEKIILIGSRARGDARPDSDFDFLVVMSVQGSKREKQLEIRTALHDVPVPKDIIVSRPEEYEWRRDIVGTVEHPADREGKLLYGRA